MNSDILQARECGVSSVYPNAKFMPYYKDKNGHLVVDFEKTKRELAYDSATAVNNGAPSALYIYIDPRTIEVLFAVTNAARIFPFDKGCSWTDDFSTYQVEEINGQVTVYSDYADNSKSDVNYNYPVRQNFRYQTNISFGDLETERLAAAKIQLVARKQNAAAQIIGRAENRFQLYGVKGLQIYGLLNCPDLNPTIAPTSINAKSTWAEKCEADPGQASNIVYNDILKLRAELSTQNGGNLAQDDRIILAISNKMVTYLNASNTYGQSAKMLLQQNFPNIEIVELPELSTASGEMLLMVVPELFGDATGFCAFSEKMRMGRLIPHSTSYEQKVMAGTCGCVIRRPSLVATMTGI